METAKEKPEAEWKKTDRKCPGCGGVLFSFLGVAIACENSDQFKKEPVCDFKLMSG